MDAHFNRATEYGNDAVATALRDLADRVGRGGYDSAQMDWVQVLADTHEDPDWATPKPTGVERVTILLRRAQVPA